MTATNEYLKQLGQEIAGLLGGEFRFYKSKLELRRKRADGFDVIVLSGSNKWSPYVSVSFYFGRNFDAARKVEKAIGSEPMPYQIQQYSLSAGSMKSLGYLGNGSWEVNVEEPPDDLAISIKNAIEEIAYPFFERFSTLKAAQRALEVDDSWCFSPKGPFYHMIFKVDAALNEIEHFKKWSKCLDEFYQEQASEDLAKLEAISSKTSHNHEDDSSRIPVRKPMAFYSERGRFEKEVLKAVASRIKGTRWKKNKNAIFCQIDGYYFDVFITSHRGEMKTFARISVKPMSLDSLYWKITKLGENDKQPMSFRSWGAFTCSGIPLLDTSIEDDGVVADRVASELLLLSDNCVGTALSELPEQEFSKVISSHPNQRARGAYAITHVVSLIEEGSLLKAKQTALGYLDGSLQSVAAHDHKGKDFHELAIEWIDSKGAQA